MEYQNNSGEQASAADLLYDVRVHLVQASGGKRFANYIIDLIIFYALAIGIGIVWALTSPDTLDSLANNDTPGFGFADRVIALALYGLIMGLIEGIFKGKTLGKLITGTKAVNEDGSTITFGTAMARGFSRAVPFCVFSALGSPSYPWQDKWTNTYVIDERRSGLRN